MLADNWEYVIAGLLVVAGGVMMVSGFGAGVGAGLVSAGFSMGIQKYTTGEVSITQTIIDGLLGLGGLGGFRFLSSTRTLTTTLTRTTTSSLTKNGSSSFSSMSGLKTTLTSKDFWIKTGVNTGKDAALGGVSVYVEAKLEGKSVTWREIGAGAGSNVLTGWISTPVDSGIKKVTGKITTSGGKAEGVITWGLNGIANTGIGIAGSAVQGYLAEGNWDHLSDTGEWIQTGFYSTFDGFNGASSSSTTDWALGHLGDDASLSYELVHGTTYDTLGTVIGWAEKGAYQEYAPEDWKSQPSKESQSTDTTDESMTEESMSGS